MIFFWVQSYKIFNACTKGCQMDYQTCVDISPFCIEEMTICKTYAYLLGLSDYLILVQSIGCWP